MKGLIARVTIIIPLILGTMVTIVVDVFDNLWGILTALRNGEITIPQQRAIDFKRSKRRWAILAPCANLAPFFTIEE